MILGQKFSLSLISLISSNNLSGLPACSALLPLQWTSPRKGARCLWRTSPVQQCVLPLQIVPLSTAHRLVSSITGHPAAMHCSAYIITMSLASHSLRRFKLPRCGLNMMFLCCFTWRSWEEGICSACPAATLTKGGWWRVMVYSTGTAASLWAVRWGRGHKRVRKGALFVWMLLTSVVL